MIRKIPIKVWILKGLWKCTAFVLIAGLAACSSKVSPAGSGLAADDLWDWLAVERDKPLPQAQEDRIWEAGDSRAEKSPGPERLILSPEDQKAYDRLFAQGPELYEALARGHDQALAALEQAHGTGTDVDMHRGGVELHMSRLLGLRRDLTGALEAVGQETASGGAYAPSAAQIDAVRALSMAIQDRLTRGRARLHELKPQ